MSIIDAHHHFWWHARRPHQWPAGAGDRLDRDFTPDDLLPELRNAGVDGTVLVQSLNDLEETKEYLDLANATPWVRGVVGWAPLDNPAGCEVVLDMLRTGGKLVGIRHLMRVEHTPGWLRQAEVLESLSQVARAGLVFESVPISAEQFESVLAIAGRIPQLSVVVDHLGRPPVPEQGWEPWASLIKRASEHPNVAIKLSTGMDLILRWQWDTESLRRYIDHVIHCFGATRVMAASNWPVVLIAGSYQQVWSGITALVSGYGESERRDILGGAATRIYRRAD